MVGLPGDVRDRREDVITFQAGVVGQYLFKGRPVGEQFEDVTDTDPHAADAQLAAALSGLDRDPLKGRRGHALILPMT